MRIVYPSGEVRVDFLTHAFTNTTPFALDPDFAETPAGRTAWAPASAAFVAAVRGERAGAAGHGARRRARAGPGAGGGAGYGAAGPGLNPRRRTQPMSNAYDFSFTSIDGEPLPLSAFKGKPVLVVNVASKLRPDPAVRGHGGALPRLPRQGPGGAGRALQPVRRPGAGDRGRDQGLLRRPSSTSTSR